MSEPRINWQGEKLYLHDADTGVWRVYDCILVGGRVRAVPLSDPRALHREFVNRDGTRRVLQFRADTPRSISPRRLGEQLAAATPAPKEGADSPAESAGVELDARERH